jgi:hypothetical protein
MLCCHRSLLRHHGGLQDFGVKAQFDPEMIIYYGNIGRSNSCGVRYLWVDTTLKRVDPRNSS